MNVFFHAQMDEGSGVPEFFLEEPNGGRHDYDIDVVRESLEFMLQQLQFFASSELETEYDLSLIDQDLVFWELEPEDDGYETTTAERIATTTIEVEYQLEVLRELETKITSPVSWAVEGF